MPYEVASVCWQEGCDKPFVKKQFVPSSLSATGASFELECEDGHQCTYYPAGLVYEECPKTKEIDELLYACASMPPAWELSREGGWEKFGEKVAKVLQCALKVDALFPDGLQAMAKKLALID